MNKLTIFLVAIVVISLVVFFTKVIIPFAGFNVEETTGGQTAEEIA